MKVAGAGRSTSVPTGCPSATHLVVSIEAQRPPEPSRPGVVRFGVGDHARLVPDARRFHYCRERLGQQEQVPHSSPVRPAQVSLPVQVDSSWKMSLLVESPTRPITAPSGIDNAYIAIGQVRC